MDYATQERQAFIRSGKRTVTREEKVARAIKTMGARWVLHPQHKPNKKASVTLCHVPNLAHGPAIEYREHSLMSDIKQIIGWALR